MAASSSSIHVQTVLAVVTQVARPESPSTALRRNKRTLEQGHIQDSEHDVSVSSEAEELKKRRRRPKKSTRRDPVDTARRVLQTIPLPLPSAPFAQFDASPEVKPFRDLLEQFPYMIEQVDDSAGAAQSSTALVPTPARVRAQDDIATFRNAIEEEKLNPVLHNVVREQIARLPRPDFVVDTGPASQTKTDIITLLRTRRRLLQVLNCDMESELLQEAGTFIHPTTKRAVVYPPCAFGNECKGLTLPFRGRGSTGCILTMTMFPREYSYLIEQGVAPMVSRPCIICARYWAASFYFTVQSHPTLVSIDSDSVYQIYRNLCDQPGGYHRDHMLAPDSDVFRGFVDMICGIRLSLMPMSLDPITRRTRIDQSALIWRSIPAIMPDVGESRQDFQRRSRDHHSTREVFLDRMRYTDPRDSRLRYMIAVNYGTLSDMHDETAAAYNAPCTEEQHYVAAVTYDSLFPSVRVFSSSLMYYDHTVPCNTLPSYAAVFCEDTVLDAHNKASRCCFWNSTRGNKDQYRSLLCKLVPQGCQRRRFAKKVDDFGDSQPGFAAHVAGWAVCSLLGNYRHVEQSYRPSLSVRDRILEEFSRDSRTIMSMFYVVRPHPQKRGRKVVVPVYEMILMFFLREYLVYTINNDPMLLAHVSLLFDWDLFRRYTIQTANAARVLLHLSIERGELLKPDTPIIVATQNPKAPFRAELNPDIDQICAVGRQVILNVSYKRPGRSVLDDFHNIKAHIQKTGLVLPTSSLGEEVKSAVQSVVRTLHPLNADLVHELLQLLPALGSSTEATREFRYLYQMHDISFSGKKPIAKQARVLATRYPQTTAIVDFFAQSVRNTHWLHIHALPHHYRHFQLDAIRSRFALPASAAIPLEAMEFWFCAECRSFYSIHISIGKPCKRHDTEWCKLCHKPYEFGYQRMVVDYDTDMCYCRPKKRAVSARVKQAVSQVYNVRLSGGAGSDLSLSDVLDFHDLSSAIPTSASSSSSAAAAAPQPTPQTKGHPLTKVFLLGQLLVINRIMIMLCPHRGCGRPMTLNTEKCKYTARGYVCSRCTEVIRKEERKRQIPVPIVSSVCAKCDKGIPANAPAFHYPKGIMLCAKHHRPQCVTAVQRYLANTTKEITRDGVLETILEAHRQMRELYMQLNARRNQARLNASKRRLRAGRKGH